MKPYKNYDKNQHKYYLKRKAEMHYFPMWLNHDDYAKLVKKAIDSKMTMSDVIRNLLKEDVMESFELKIFLQKEDLEKLHEITWSQMGQDTDIKLEDSAIIAKIMLCYCINNWGKIGEKMMFDYEEAIKRNLLKEEK